MEEAKAKMEQEKEQSKEVKREIWELISWTEIFDYAETDTKKMIIARLVKRIDVGADYTINIQCRINYAAVHRRGSLRKGIKEPRGATKLFAVFFYGRGR